MCYHINYGISSEFKFFFITLYCHVSLQGKLPLAMLLVSFIPNHILTQVWAYLFHISFIWCYFSALLAFLLPALLFYSQCSSNLCCQLYQSKILGPILILVMEIYSTKWKKEELFCYSWYTRVWICDWFLTFNCIHDFGNIIITCFHLECSIPNLNFLEGRLILENMLLILIVCLIMKSSGNGRS